ncbi:hypothetical protein [Pseudoalteromonas sp. BDTF-M6]|uniref:hypothetical protein n=1 Tax=Pseudoalteromonas sp. BDTF-M6 TaxID=2796132 RepID=UPI001BAE8245|nr:hypothetical protein [Pseudoalteromonas sp. BDTF-M6]MBS3798382.1 hypothetical protein [Pseudoalteromonas sp. BDTF-M6]
MAFSLKEIFLLFSFEDIARLFNVFINWGLMMALLFNVVSYSAPEKRDSSPLRLCMVLVLSYLSTYYLEWDRYMYLYWSLADAATILLLYLVQLRKKKIAALYYCIAGLTVNGLLHLWVYYDLYITGTEEYWWLWSLYPLSVNVIDAIIITALIINRDFLGLCRAARGLRGKWLGFAPNS